LSLSLDYVIILQRWQLCRLYGKPKRFVLLVENGELRITTPQKRAERAQQLFKKYVGADVRLSEELIADRRKEAAGE
jgi:hypothetical protein